MRDYVDKITNKFLAWELPKSVRADGCALTPEYNGIRTGTNLLNFTEARLMVVHLFSELLDEHENLQKFTTQYENKCVELEARCKELEEENRRLKAQLEKCKEQRNKECKNAIYNDKDNAWRIENYDKELDSIE